MPDIRDLSRRKRHGEELGAEELAWIVAEYTAGRIDEAPMAAWLMAVCCAGMTEPEVGSLTEAMAHSGRMLDLSDLARPTVDKHSTGGVGDKVSLVACPIAAACGACVAKMSGRGLGHTGGTIDKLEAIPGLRTDLSAARFRAQAEEIGLVIAAQSADLAPADGRMYALRDATGTVDSPALIASSIMSKKLAAGARAIVLEVTVGSGAFMRTEKEAWLLATLMVEIGRRSGRTMGAVITSMDQPLGRAVGNAVEVEEAVAALGGAGPDDVVRVSSRVAAWMLVAAGLASDLGRAETMVSDSMQSGAALDRLREMVVAQGGDPDVLDHPMMSHRPRVTGELRASRSGFLSRVDARRVGEAALLAGAGRRRKGEQVDPAAGIRLAATAGQPVESGDLLAQLMAGSQAHLAEARAHLATAFEVGEGPPMVPDLVLAEMPPVGGMSP